MSVRVHAIPMGMGMAHLVETEQGMLLVDAGMPDKEGRVLRRMARIGRDDLRLIFITHGHMDHYGSAAALRRLTGAPIAIHGADAEPMARGESPVRYARGIGKLMVALTGPFESRARAEGTPPDITVADGDSLESVGLSASILHTPGHTDGSSCLIVDGRLAFAGDLLQGLFRPQLQRAFALDWALLPVSLQRLQAARPESVYTGHRRRPFLGSEIQNLR